MTAQEFARDARARIEKAHAEVNALCHGKRWHMEIPANPAEDSDLVIDDGLRAGEEALDLVTTGTSPCGHWQGYAVTVDGGKHITCLQCDKEQAETRLVADEQRWRLVEEALQDEGLTDLSKLVAIGSLAQSRRPPTTEDIARTQKLAKEMGICGADGEQAQL